MNKTTENLEPGNYLELDTNAGPEVFYFNGRLQAKNEVTPPLPERLLLFHADHNVLSRMDLYSPPGIHSNEDEKLPWHFETLLVHAAFFGERLITVLDPKDPRCRPSPHLAIVRRVARILQLPRPTGLSQSCEALLNPKSDLSKLLAKSPPPSDQERLPMARALQTILLAQEKRLHAARYEQVLDLFLAQFVDFFSRELNPSSASR